ncbi:tyrosine-type recombinase/integrase [Halorubrum sp. N11]|uniref:tyrosine-type recombinase/integrase n=1 Tax=Halorubrum sp. N11 TaxID=3402276 RepID=UPI003EBBFF4D
MSTLDKFVDGVPEAETLYQPGLGAQYDTGEKKLNDARRRIIEEKDLTQSEKRMLYQFDRELRNLNNREDRHRKVTRALHIDLTRLLQRDSGLLIDILDDSMAGKETLDDLLDWVQEQGYSNNYIHNQLITVQTFGELLGSEIVQDRVDKIQPGQFRDDDSTPLPGNVLAWLDAVSMAETQSKIRDQAMILSEWGLGSRPDSEFLWLQYKHLEWHDGHYRVTIPWDGKTGERTVRMFAGAAGLRRWVEEEHPVHADPEAELGPETPIWTKLNENERMKYDNMYRVFKKAGKAAAISKDTNPQHFRRSRASFLAGKPSVSEAELRRYFGWSYESNSPKHYVAKFRTDVDRNIALADGASVQDFEPPKKVAPIECNHCGRWTERHLTNCVCCGAEVGEERHEAHVDATMADAETDLLSMIISGDVGPGDLRSVKKLWGVIRDRPKLGEELDDLITKTERMANDEKASVYGGIGAMASIGVGHAVNTGQRAAAAWGRAKHRGMAMHPDWEHYPKMSAPRQMGLGVGLGLLLTLLLGSWYVNGTFEGLAAGEMTSWIPVVVAVVYGMWLFNRELPDPDDAAEAMQ